MNIEIIDFGKIYTAKALEAQDLYWSEKVYTVRSDKLIFAEHEPVYTAGLRCRDDLELMKGCFKVPLWKLPCPTLITGRGGLVTYQGPGILSVYAVFNVPNFEPRKFNDMLLSSAEQVLKFFGVISRRSDVNPGLYVGPDKKIVSVGLKYSRGVTRFGMTLSLEPDESYLKPLIPCGIAGVRMTSLKEETGVAPGESGRSAAIKILSGSICELFKKMTRPD